MTGTLSLGGGRGLVVVAHPDDETIWMGGVILANPQVRWTVFSLCRSRDADRAPKFKSVCKHYGARAIISDLEDEGVMNIKESVPEILKRIKKLLPRRRYDYVFTHGANGEYGHPRHKGAYRVMKKLVMRNEICAKASFCFDYRLDERKGIAVPNGNGKWETGKREMRNEKWVIKLTREIFKKKRDVIEKMYGFRKSSFEYRSCSAVETFHVL